MEGGCAEALEPSPQGEVILKMTESELSLLGMKALRDGIFFTGGILLFSARRVCFWSGRPHRLWVVSRLLELIDGVHCHLK